MIEKDILTTTARQQFFQIIHDVRDHNMVYTIRDCHGFSIAVICKPADKRLRETKAVEFKLRKLTRQLFDLMGQYLDGPPHIIRIEPKPDFDPYQ